MSNTVARSSQTVVVNSGEIVSPNIDLRNVANVALGIPTITSGQLFFQVGQSSGTYFGRLFDPRSQGNFFINANAGSLAVVIDALGPFDHGRIEFANSQANVASIDVVKARA